MITKYLLSNLFFLAASVAMLGLAIYFVGSEPWRPLADAVAALADELESQ